MTGDLVAAGAVVAAILRRPSLWATAVRQIVVFAPNGWWRRRPFLPIPPPEYVEFRLVTAYGPDPPRVPPPADVVEFLVWCRGFGRASRRKPSA